MRRTVQVNRSTDLSKSASTLCSVASPSGQYVSFMKSVLSDQDTVGVSTAANQVQDTEKSNEELDDYLTHPNRVKEGRDRD